ncbi:MAG: DUF2333 family protein [Deltaproteobacteria bacterium]|nr:DUF2333 family protein [Deltaproteobacteria bacterium]
MMENIFKKKGGKKRYGLFIFMILIALSLFVVIIMAVNSRKPGYLTLDQGDQKIKGAYFIKTNQALIKQMYENWLPNDIFWPTVLLDNMPYFQIGELEVIRYNVRVLRDNLSRMRTTDKLDSYAESAFTSLSNDPYKWWFPSAEGKWKLGYQNLEYFYQDLLKGKSHFYPRADNLVDLLNQYVSLMGGANTRLINAPRDINKTLSIEEQKKENSGETGLVDIDIPWHRIDDNFYYAQGVAYALYESFRTIRFDFIDVLTDKNSVMLVDKILEVLGRCNFEPLVVFNGNPDSIFANHSLNLSGVFNDARQKVNSLIVALKQG